jgi:hypothetical protein
MVGPGEGVVLFLVVITIDSSFLLTSLISFRDRDISPFFHLSTHSAILPFLSRIILARLPNNVRDDIVPAQVIYRRVLRSGLAMRRYCQ